MLWHSDDTELEGNIEYDKLQIPLPWVQEKAVAVQDSGPMTTDMSLFTKVITFAIEKNPSAMYIGSEALQKYLSKERLMNEIIRSNKL